MPEVKKTASSVKQVTAAKTPVTEVKKLTEEIVKAEAKKDADAKKVTTKKVAAKKPAEKPAKKAEPKKTVAKKAETKTEAKKAPAKKPAEKKVAPKADEIKVSVELQYSYKHIPYEDIVQNSKNHFQYEMGGNVDEIKTLSVYVKPDEDAAYYVVNDKVQGRIGL